METTTAAPTPTIAWSFILLRHPDGGFLGDSGASRPSKVPTPGGAKTWPSRDALRAWLILLPSSDRDHLDAEGYAPVVLDSRLRYVPEAYLRDPERPALVQAAGYQ